MSLGLHLGLTVGNPALSAGGGWSPLKLGDKLLAWWTADDLSTMTLVGSAVSAWRDKKNGYEVSQALSAARPIYSAVSFGGGPGLTLDGVDDRLALESQPFPSGAIPSEIWGVAQQNALAGDTSFRALFTYGGPGNDMRSIRRAVSSGVNRARGTVGTGGAVVNVDSNVVDFSSRHVIRTMFGATETSISADGQALASVAAVPATGVARVRIGATSGATAGFFWSGQVRDLIVTAALSADEASALETYLLGRRAL